MSRTTENSDRTSAAELAAQMGWELVNADEDVDIRNMNIKALSKIPIGNYASDIVNLR